MILGDEAILKEIKRKNIIVEPFNRDHLNPNSVDLTLNRYYKIWQKHSLLDSNRLIGSGFNDMFLDCRNNNIWVEKRMPDTGMVLQPGRLYLYSCNEKIGVPCKNRTWWQRMTNSGYLRAKVEGKSSLGRLGLFVHVTAGFIDTGFTGSLVLEMVATEPIKIYPNQKICQLEFARVEGGILESYDSKEGSKYMNQQGVQHSKMHENFSTK